MKVLDLFRLNVMSVDPQEIIAFKAALARTPVDVIVKRLNDNVILRTWKRNLAEAEVARRSGESSRGRQRPDKLLPPRHRAAEMLSWLATAFIVLCLLAGAAAVAVRIINT